MATSETVQRRSRSRKKSDTRIIRVQIKDRLGNSRWVTADLLNTSEDGVGIMIRTPLAVGSKIVLRGELGESRVNTVSPATVKWCLEETTGDMHAGLELGENLCGSGEEAGHQRDSMEGLDWYEIMQLSPNADTETVARVYRILAQRYHPDSSTGDPIMFMRLCEAHRVLSDPELRAKYDALHRETRRLHWKIFDRTHLASAPQGEQRKRQGILEALYAKALVDPERAMMSVFEFEELLGCPREHLEAALWYLKGKGYIKRGDNGRCVITVAGFDEVEGSRHTNPVHDYNLLEAGERVDPKPDVTG